MYCCRISLQYYCLYLQWAIDATLNSDETPIWIWAVQYRPVSDSNTKNNLLCIPFLSILLLCLPFLLSFFLFLWTWTKTQYWFSPIVLVGTHSQAHSLIWFIKYPCWFKKKKKCLIKSRNVMGIVWRQKQVLMLKLKLNYIFWKCEKGIIYINKYLKFLYINLKHVRSILNLYISFFKIPWTLYF